MTIPTAPTLPTRATAQLPEADHGRHRTLMEHVRQLEQRARGVVEPELAGSYRAAFLDTRELPMMLLVDVSGCAELGAAAARTRELSAELAGALAMAAISDDDPVGLILFSDRIERYVAPSKARNHVQRIVREVLGCRPEGNGTDVAAALQLAGTLAHRRSLMFVISDLELGPQREPALHALRRAARPVAARHDVVALHVRDPHLCVLPDVGLLTVEDAETGRVLAIDTTRPQVRDRFRALADQRAGEVAWVLGQTNVETVCLDVTQPYAPALLALFARRAGSER
ncbi:MAG: DUF58 domain-containing protein [Kofleriaceae bacterium]